MSRKAATSAAVAPAPDVSTGDKLIRTICLTIQPMTREAMAPYGELILERSQMDLDLDGGAASLVAQVVEARRLEFDFLGRHQRTEQVFVPIGGARSVIALAPPTKDDTLDLAGLVAFLIDGTNAFKLHRGTWHTSAFPLGDRATFLVFDRKGTLEEDYDLRDLKTTHGVVVEIVQ